MSDEKPDTEEKMASDAKDAIDDHEAKDEAKTGGRVSNPDGTMTTTETDPTDDEVSDLNMAARSKPDEPKKNDDHGHGHDGHGHDGHDGHDGHGDGHGLAHTTPVSLLFGILGALLVLTIATVAVTSIDLGAQGNLIVAMAIATVKAGLVCTFFMHLLWDKKFNTVLFLTSVLFLILFLSMTTTDRGEYQQQVDDYRAQQLGK
jgi:cytochrome c oxidase subunit IV